MIFEPCYIVHHIEGDVGTYILRTVYGDIDVDPDGILRILQNYARRGGVVAGKPLSYFMHAPAESEKVGLLRDPLDPDWRPGKN